MRVHGEFGELGQTRKEFVQLLDVAGDFADAEIVRFHDGRHAAIDMEGRSIVAPRCPVRALDPREGFREATVLRLVEQEDFKPKPVANQVIRHGSGHPFSARENREAILAYFSNRWNPHQPLEE